MAKENMKIPHITIEVNRTNLDKYEDQVDRIIEKLEIASSLADELASNDNCDRLATLEKPILDSAHGTVLNGIDISKLPIRSCISTNEDTGFRTVTVVIRWTVK